MKTWEQTEFEMQQKSIKEWAEKEFKKTYHSRFFWRKLGKLNKLVKIITGNPKACVDIKVYPKGAEEDE